MDDVLKDVCVHELVRSLNYGCLHRYYDGNVKWSIENIELDKSKLNYREYCIDNNNGKFLCDRCRTLLEEQNERLKFRYNNIDTKLMILYDKLQLLLEKQGGSKK